MTSIPVEVKKSASESSSIVPSWQSLRSEMDRLFDSFAASWCMPSLGRIFNVGPSARLKTSFSIPDPAVDISEDDTSFKLTAELPGMSEKDVEVVVSDSALTIKGEKQQQKEQKEKDFYLSERSYGSFQRSFTLPDGVETDKITAEFSKGVLAVNLPKTAQARQHRKIEVKATS